MLDNEASLVSTRLVRLPRQVGVLPTTYIELKHNYHNLCSKYYHPSHNEKQVGKDRVPRIDYCPHAVGPDKANFGISWQKLKLQKQPKCLVTFWPVVKTIAFKSNWLGYFLGNFWINLGYFLFQDLVTLPTCYLYEIFSLMVKWSIINL